MLARSKIAFQNFKIVMENKGRERVSLVHEAPIPATLKSVPLGNDFAKPTKHILEQFLRHSFDFALPNHLFVGISLFDF